MKVMKLRRDKPETWPVIIGNTLIARAFHLIFYYKGKNLEASVIAPGAIELDYYAAEGCFSKLNYP